MVEKQALLRNRRDGDFTVFFLQIDDDHVDVAAVRSEFAAEDVQLQIEWESMLAGWVVRFLKKAGATTVRPVSDA